MTIRFNLSRIRPQKWIELSILCFCFFILLPSAFTTFPGHALDPSWQIGLNMAVAQDLVFGKDFVFTYGPLGYFHTGLNIFVWKGGLFLFHFFLIANAFYILRLIIDLLDLKDYFFLCLFFLFIGDLLVFHPTILLFIFFIFYLIFTIFKKAKITLLLCSSIAILSFFIKLNTGVVLNLWFLLLLFLLAFLNGRLFWLRALVYLFLHLGVLFFLAAVLKVDMAGYIKGSLHLIGAFNDAMMIYPPQESLLYALISVSLLAIALLVEPKFWLLNVKPFVLLAFVTGGTFILFKQGFVRADTHRIEFFIYYPALFGFLYLFIEPKRLKKVTGAGFILAFIFSALGIQQMNPDYNLLAYLEKIPYKNEWQNQKNYPGVMDYIFRKSLEERSLPPDILAEIGSKSIDILPWEISYAYYHNLTYNPRPTPQSYSAYDPYLDHLNAQKFLSADAPDYVLFHHYEAIEQYRNAFWDESQTKLAILRHYEPILFQENFLLLKRRSANLHLTELSAKAMELNWNDTLQIEKSDYLQYLYADIEYNVWGKLRRFFFQPNWNNVFLDIVSQERPKQYRAIIPIMRGGVLINREVSSKEDYFNFFSSFGQENSEVRKIYFTTDRRWMKKKIKITIREFQVLR